MTLPKYFDQPWGNSGIVTPISDTVTGDGTANYPQGWTNAYQTAVASGGKTVNMAIMNQLGLDITTALQQLQNYGCANWYSTVSYSQYAKVLYTDGVVYKSLVNSNTATPGTDATKWQADTLVNVVNIFTGGTTTGSANAQVLASLSPATGFSLSNNGQTIVCTAGYTNTGGATLAVTSPAISATTIKKDSGSGLVALTGGEIVAGDTLYLTVNTAGSCLVLTSGLALGTAAYANTGTSGATLPFLNGNNTWSGTNNGVTPAPLDNSTLLATTAAVILNGLRAGAVNFYTTGQTLTTVHLGTTVFSNSATAMTHTLPSVASCPNGTRIEFFNFNAGVVTIQHAGSDNIFTGNSTVTSIAHGQGDSLTLESAGGSWFVVNGSAQLPFSAQFGRSLGSSGYQMLPGGLILQWGVASTTTAGVTVTLPIAFPNTFFKATATHNTAKGNTTEYCAVNQNGLTSIDVTGVTTMAVYWFAIGN